MILESGNTLSCESLNIGCKLPDENLTLEHITKRHILSVLDSVDGNKQQAAVILGVDSSTIYRKLKEYGIV